MEILAGTINNSRKERIMSECFSARISLNGITHQLDAHLHDEPDSWTFVLSFPGQGFATVVWSGHVYSSEFLGSIYGWLYCNMISQEAIIYIYGKFLKWCREQPTLYIYGLREKHVDTAIAAAERLERLFDI